MENVGSTWHPAFMPNSAEDTSATKRLVIETTEEAKFPPHASNGHGTIETDRVKDASSNSKVEASEPVAITKEIIDDDDADPPDQATATERISEDNAAVESIINQDNVLNSAEVQDKEVADEKAHQIANPSTTGVAYTAGHTSTTSFARTVSADINWGEDDQVDDSWNLPRSDTDPFKLMGASDRTNSFPAVPASHSALKDGMSHSTPHSQAEAVISGFQGPGNPAFDDITATDDDDDFFKSQGETQVEEPETGVMGSLDNQQGYSLDASTDDARYEEGLPLVGLSESAEALHTENMFSKDEGDDDDESFFRNVTPPAAGGDDSHAEGGSASDVHDMAPLGRKSTMQVMDSINYEPHEKTHEQTSSKGDEADARRRKALALVTGGGIAVSRSTVLSQVLGESDSGGMSPEKDEITDKLDTSEAGLAAKWQAALADVNFFDDDMDDLLPDSASTKSGMDSSALFGSDDEGFLDDDDDKEETTGTNAASAIFTQKNSALPAPVMGPNGQVIGFSNLSGSAVPHLPPNGNHHSPANIVTRQPQTSSSYDPNSGAATPTTISATTSPAYGAPYFQPQMNGQLQPQRPVLPKAQSFADKAKGGYASPYDLPMEVVKPRKRGSMQHMSRGFSQQGPVAPGPPPRSRSMYSPVSPLTPQEGPPSISAQTSGQSQQSFQRQPPNAVPKAPAAPPPLKSSNSFFEDLPVTSKSRPAGRYAPQSNIQSGSGNAPPLPQGPPMQSQSLPGQGLVPPPRLNPYATMHAEQSVPSPVSAYSPLQTSSQSKPTPPPVAQSRYSPAPPQRQAENSYTKPPATTATIPSLTHQPRTSSPLAQFERRQDTRTNNVYAPVPGGQPRQTSFSSREASTLSSTQEVEEPILECQITNQGVFDPASSEQYSRTASAPGTQIASRTPPPSKLSYSPSNLSSPKQQNSNYAPQSGGNLQKEQSYGPLRRSQTQSPSTVLGHARPLMIAEEPYQRASSVQDFPSPIITAPTPYPSMTDTVKIGRPRGFTQEINFVAPTDGQELDPLERWKGSPVFMWGAGGSVVTSFPIRVPRYSMNQTAPMMICSPGEIKIRSIKEVFPLEERLSNFPGPLKAKSKKKEVLSWLSGGIDALDAGNAYLASVPSLSHEDKRREEHALLWKILRVLVEHDGLLEGSPNVDKAVRDILSPSAAPDLSSTAPTYATGAELSGIAQSATSKTHAEPVDPAAVDDLRKYLLRGEREQAVWQAVDKRLWAHAMLISHTVSRDLYKQVAQEFVQKEVKSTGENTESLAALYEIFAGNYEESIDELVPPSARAGFQMISTSNNGPSKGGVDGLDRWRETLGLVLSNRSVDDVQAIFALGKLLSGYGRVEAAHICFMFSRRISVFGGADDPQSNIVLLGSDVQSSEFGKDTESILLSEVYEFALSLSASSNSTTAAHLSAYKLSYAVTLTESGYRDKALQYCEAIASSVTSQTRRSPYYHSHLLNGLDDLSKRLKMSPKDASSSWISKPSMDKVSGSVWAKFNKFVAGDESDSASNGEGGSEVGPFAKIAGSTPVSRSPSVADIYGANSGAVNGAVPVPSNPSLLNSRYAPGGSYTSQPGYESRPTSSYAPQPYGAVEQRSSNEYVRGAYEPQRQNSTYQPSPPSTSASRSYEPQAQSGYSSPINGDSSTIDSPYPGAPSGYPPGPPSVPAPDMSSTNPYDSPLNPPPPPQMQSQESFNGPYSSQNSLYAPPNNESGNTSPATNGYEAPPQASSSNGYGPPVGSTYEAPKSGGGGGGYEPPTSGYAPPLYEPATMDNDAEDSYSTRPSRKTYGDDIDDDDYNNKPIAGKAGEKSKAEKDREADEAFRRAAEEDAKRDAAASAPAKKGWGLGGWFGGAAKKDDVGGAAASSTSSSASAAQAQPNKPIRAKLGEESSFYFDPDLKRWVNKKAGKDGLPERATATPPPPRATAGPRPGTAGSNADSGGGGGGPPPPGMRSSSRGAPAGTPPPMMSRNASSTGAAAAASRAVSGASVGAGGGGTGDELTAGGGAGGPGGGGGGGGSAPPSRPSTGKMSHASSIDDLLGPAGAGGGTARRAAGAAKKAKKGRGYIDLMDKGSAAGGGGA